MTHPGLPDYWVYLVWALMIVLCLVVLFRSQLISTSRQSTISLGKIKLIAPVMSFLKTNRWPLQLLQLLVVLIFLLVIYAGLMGTQIPQANIATVLTWNIWWAGLILSIFFLGSAWCAVCPWNTLATWYVKPKLWWIKLNNSLELTPPKWLRSVWPALMMFVGLTWLELGYGVTTSPYATALLSLLMVLLATASLALYKNRAFCHYICPVGRTIGFYAQLAPVELRPVDQAVCNDCKTLECFNGSATIDACPTQLVMGRLTQNTYCTSCGNCVQSCPSANVAWRIRPQSQEAIQSARPHWDEAWFMLVLLTLTSFHGITMMEFWETGLRHFAQFIGDSGRLLPSFTVGLFLSILMPVSVYALAVQLLRKFTATDVSFKKLFSSLVFVSLPLAFAYHLAHNLNHLIRESVGVSQVIMNPLGYKAEFSSASDQLLLSNSMLLTENTIFLLQTTLMLFGFWIAIKVLKHRAQQLVPGASWRLWPMLVFIVAIHGFHLWMLSQPMVMRVGALCVVPSGI